MSNLNTAVLLMVFNRPEATVKALEAIRKAKPPRLYIAADGPRENLHGELEKVEKVREIVSSIDWPCDVKRLFRDSNLGCKYAVSTAIDWFFQYEEEGIILEDDIVPEGGFFRFCELALKRYRHNPLVGMITGNSVVGYEKLSDDRHNAKFSTYGLVWGWATWRRVWDQYDVEIQNWDSQDFSFLRQKKCANSLYVEMWSSIFNNVRSGKIDSWAYQLNYLLLRKSLLCVVPPYNIIDNIGFSGEATHTSGGRPIWLVYPKDINPEEVIFSEAEIDHKLDQLIGANIFGITSFARIKNRIKKLIIKLCQI